MIVFTALLNGITKRYFDGGAIGGKNQDSVPDRFNASK